MSDRHFHTLIKRFPEHWGQIIDLSANSSDFQALCEDYEAALKAANWWHKVRQAGGKEREQEYRDVAGQLELEMLDMLVSEDVRQNSASAEKPVVGGETKNKQDK